jgi:type II secretion system protein N
VKKVLDFFLNIFRHHKLKILAAFAFFSIFFVVLFPFDDLGDMLTTIVAQQTANQVFVTSDHLGISLLPQPALKAEGAAIELAGVPGLPPLKAKTLHAGLSIPMLLSFNLGFHVRAQGMFGGSIKASAPMALLEGMFSPVPSKESKTYNASIALDDINLKDVTKTFDLPAPLAGRLSADTSIEIDPSFSKQPDGELDLSASKVVVEAFSIPTPMGPIQLPRLSMKSLKASGYIKNGKLNIENARLGETSDPIYASIRGQMDVNIKKGRRGLNMQPGAFDLTVEMQVQSEILKAIPYFAMLDAYTKAKTATATQYSFQISAPRIGMPPNIKKIQ